MKNHTVRGRPGLTVKSVKVRVVRSDTTGRTGTTIWTIRDLRARPQCVESGVAPTYLMYRNRVSRADLCRNRRIGPGGSAGPTVQQCLGNLERGRKTHQRRHPRCGRRIIRRASTGGRSGDFLGGSRESSSWYPWYQTKTIGIHTQLDVQVKISLSPGLAFGSVQSPPSGTTFDPSTGIWDVGTLKSFDPGKTKEFDVAVTFSDDSLTDLPLGERCLTAEVIRAVPWFTFHQARNGVTTFPSRAWGMARFS